ncbi:MAG: hypothetical protein ABSE92_11775, partial [Terriglobales bacterium]
IKSEEQAEIQEGIQESKIRPDPANRAVFARGCGSSVHARTRIPEGTPGLSPHAAVSPQSED